nr:hypothetical protein [Anaeromyxobacter sp. SG22]
MAFEARGEGRLVASLRDVIQLLEDPLPDLQRDPLGFDARGEQAHRSDDQREVREVGADRRRDVRVLHLHGHRRPVVEHAAMDLPDRGRGDRHGVDPVERVAQRPAQRALDHRRHLREGPRRGRRLERLERLAQLRGDLVDREGQDLAELHGEALELPEALGGPCGRGAA